MLLDVTGQDGISLDNHLVLVIVILVFDVKNLALSHKILSHGTNEQ